MSVALDANALQSKIDELHRIPNSDERFKKTKEFASILFDIISQMRATQDQLKSLNQEIQKKYQKSFQDLNQLKKALDIKLKEVADLKTKVIETEKKFEAIVKEKDLLVKADQTKNQQLGIQAQQITALCQEKELLERKQKELKDKYETIEQNNQSLNATISQLNDQVANLQAETAKKVKQCKRIKDENEKLNKAIQKGEADLKALLNKIEPLMTDCDTVLKDSQKNRNSRLVIHDESMVTKIMNYATENPLKTTIIVGVVFQALKIIIFRRW